MALIKIELSAPPIDGMDIKFKAPCNCTEITGLMVTYPEGSQEFTFRDAHRNDLAGLGNLFSQDAYVKVILDTENGFAYLQNADNNSYFTETFDRVIRSGGKNLFKHIATSTTHTGITYTPNSDGTITINGTATGEHRRSIGTVTLEQGTYIVSGIPGGKTAPNIAIFIDGTLLNYSVEPGKEATITLSQESTCELRLYFRKGMVIDNVTISPMIRFSSISDGTFEPYYKGLCQLSGNRVLVWENVSPTSEFQAQTMGFDLSKFAEIEIQFFGHKSNHQSVSTGRVPVNGKKAQMISTIYYSEASIELGTRIFTPSASGIEFHTAYYIALGGSSGWSSTVNQCIPYRIYGYREVSV